MQQMSVVLGVIILKHRGRKIYIKPSFFTDAKIFLKTDY